MKTSVLVHSMGSSPVSVISTGEVSVEILPATNDLVVKVVENGVEVKTFYFLAGYWSTYSKIVTDL